MYAAIGALRFIAFSWAIGYGKRAVLAPCVTIRHPGQVAQSGTRAGIQKKCDSIGLLLDSPSTSLMVVSFSNHGSRPPQADSSGMTGLAKGGFCNAGDK
jgi:hypothetical protein